MSKVEIPGKTEYSPCGSRTVVTSNFLRTRRVHIPVTSHADMQSAWPKCCVGIQLKGDSGNFAPANAVLVLQLVELLFKKQNHIDKQDIQKPEAVVFVWISATGAEWKAGWLPVFVDGLHTADRTDGCSANHNFGEWMRQCCEMGGVISLSGGRKGGSCGALDPEGWFFFSNHYLRAVCCRVLSAL